jgi:hypothetical protein
MYTLSDIICVASLQLLSHVSRPGCAVLTCAASVLAFISSSSSMLYARPESSDVCQRHISSTDLTNWPVIGIVDGTLGPLQDASCDAEFGELHPCCKVEVTSLSCQQLFHMKLVDYFSRHVCVQVLLKKLVCAFCQKYRLLMDVIAMCNPRIHWQVTTPTYFLGCFLLDPLMEQQRDDLNRQVLLYDASCVSCYSPCIDAHISGTRDRNCIGCDRSFLCDNRRVHIQGVPKCLLCVGKQGELQHLGRFHQLRYELFWSAILQYNF